MPAPRFRDLAAVHIGRDAASVRLPGRVDLIGDSVRGGDGLFVTLAIEPHEPTSGEKTPGFTVITTAAVQAVLVDGRSDVIRRLSLGSGEVAVLMVDAHSAPTPEKLHCRGERPAFRERLFGARRTGPPAHEPLISSGMVSDVPLTGLSLTGVVRLMLALDLMAG